MAYFFSQTIELLVDVLGCGIGVCMISLIPLYDMSRDIAKLPQKEQVLVHAGVLEVIVSLKSGIGTPCGETE
jgi:hypothetical protein